MALRPCIECGQPTDRTRCPTHEAIKQQRRNAERTHLHGEWRNLSRQQRDAVPWCQCAGCAACTPQGCGATTDLCADHVVNRDPTLLATLCRACNSTKH